jgi:hypothetical protein
MKSAGVELDQDQLASRIVSQLGAGGLGGGNGISIMDGPKTFRVFKINRRPFITGIDSVINCAGGISKFVVVLKGVHGGSPYA